MKTANSTLKQLLGVFVLLFVSAGVQAQVNIVRTFSPGSFAAECGWEIINVGTNTVYDCEAAGGTTPPTTPATLSVPAGTYQVRAYDSFGDGWNGGQISITQGGVSLCQATLSSGGFSNTCPGPNPTPGTVICTFQVQQPCQVTCPGNIVVNNDPGQCGAVVNFTVNDAGCSPPATVTPPSGSFFPIGTTTVKAQAGVAQCQFTVTVNDTEPPKINCPADMVVTLAPGECERTINYSVTGSDNCPFLIPQPNYQFPASFANHGSGTVFTWAGNNAPGGYYFNLTNNGTQPLQVTGFGVRFGNPAFGAVNPPQTVQVFTAPTFVGNETNAAAWTNLGPATVTSIPPYFATGTGPLASVNLSSPVNIPPGQTRGFYIFGQNACPVFNFNFGVSPPVTNGPWTMTGGNISTGLFQVQNLFPGANCIGNIQVYSQIAASATPVQTAGLPSGSSFHINPGVYQNCFTLTDINGLSSSCCFNITVKEYPNPTNTLACNDKVQISLDEDCSSVVGADMILEGGPYGCYDTRYTVMILGPTGQNLGNIVTASFIGKEWTVKVTDNKTGSSCWGKITVEDKLKPTITCRDVVVDCNGTLPTIPAPAIIGEQIQLQQPFDIIENGPGTSPRIYNFDYSYLPAGTPVQDVNVRIKLTGHTWLPDLNIEAISPDGTAISVFQVSGCFGQEWPIDVWFDDEGIGGITQCAALNAGGAHIQCFQLPGVQNPNVLVGFDGKNASGNWRIRITDNFPADDGVIEEVGLAITVNVPQVDPADNCGPVTTKVTDSFVPGNCAGPSAVVTRTWTVTDASGNSATCNQKVTFKRPKLDDVLVPLDIKWTCEQYNKFPNITAAKHLHPFIKDSDPATVIIDVNLDPNCDDDDQTLTDANGNIIASKDWPSVNSTNTANGGNGCPGAVYSFFPAPNSGLDDADVLALTGSGIPTIGGAPLDSICGISYEHEDLLVNVCPGTFKIVRKWTLIDWCANPVDVRQFNQVIKVVDEKGPSITAPADLTINVYSASVPAGGGPHAVCQGNFAVPAASGISDNCSTVTSYTTELWNGNTLLKTINGNGGIFTGVPMFQNGLPAKYTVRYYATDACGNQSSASTNITLVDKVPPVAVCDEITEVSITNNGIGIGTSCSTVNASVFDDGSYDNCKPVYFLMAKMDDSFSPNIFNRCYYKTRNFCCDDIGEQTVILLVLDGDPTPFFTNLNSPSLGCDGTPGLFLTSGFSALNYNTCMVTVQVTDKLSPVLQTCPPNQRVLCDWYADNLENQLKGLSSSQQCDLLSQYFGTATFWDNCSVNVTCNTSINIDQCLEGTITRTWTAKDNAGNNGLQSCTQTIFVDHVSDWVVSFPADITVNCGSQVPDFGEPKIFYETCELVAISHSDQVFTTVPDACYKIQRKWTVINWCVVGNNIDQEVVEAPENALGLPFPQCDLDKDGDCDNRTFRDSWNATSKPTAADATKQTGPDTDPDSDPWDGYIVYEQVIKVIDNVAPVFTQGCAIPDVCILSNGCSATVLLPTPTVQDCSPNVTITATSNIPGGASGFGPFTNVPPGTYNVTYKASDNCNNQTACHATVTVKDCKKPTPYCKNGLVIELMNTDPAMVQVWASDFNAGSFDNCPGTLKYSFSADTTVKSRTYTCDDLGQQPVQMWVTDAAGNQDYCETFIIVQANMGQCNDDPLVAGAITSHANNLGVKGVAVNVNSGSGGFQQTIATDANGHYSFASVPKGSDISVVPHLDTNPLNGVTTFDLVLISRHILGIEKLNSPYKIIAADANRSKTVTTFDLVELRKLILFINTNFTSNTSWRFVDKKFVFPDPTNPFLTDFPELVSINNISADQLAVDFVAIKVGDVNGSAVNNFDQGTDDRTFNGSLILQADDAIVRKGDVHTVEFRTADFLASGFQFTLNFEPEALEFVDLVPAVADAGNFGLSLLDKGAITASWNSDDLVRLPADEVLFAISFRARKDTRLSEALGINGRYTAAEAYGPAGSLLDVQLSFGNLTSSPGFALFQNTPNPFAAETSIGFILPEAGPAVLTISDVQGRVVRIIRGEWNSGYNAVNISRNELPATGVYYYRLDAGEHTATRKLVVIE